MSVNVSDHIEWFWTLKVKCGMRLEWDGTLSAYGDWISQSVNQPNLWKSGHERFLRKFPPFKKLFTNPRDSKDPSIDSYLQVDPRSPGRLFLFGSWEENALLWVSRWNYKSHWHPCNTWIINGIQLLHIWNKQSIADVTEWTFQRTRLKECLKSNSSFFDHHHI